MKLMLSECANFLEYFEMQRFDDPNNPFDMVMCLEAQAASQPPPASEKSRRGGTHSHQQHAFVPIKICVFYTDEKHAFILAPFQSLSNSPSSQGGPGGSSGGTRVPNFVHQSNSDASDVVHAPGCSRGRSPEYQQDEYIVRWEMLSEGSMDQGLSSGSHGDNGTVTRHRHARTLSPASSERGMTCTTLVIMVCHYMRIGVVLIEHGRQ